MPNDRRPPLRTRLRYRLDGFLGSNSRIDRWLNRRSRRVRILVAFATLVVLITAAEVFFSQVLGWEEYPSADPNAELLEEIDLPESVKDFQANWISSKQLERLHPGMTVDEVTTIVGSKGFVRGVDGAGFETRQWSGPGLSQSELVFQAGVLVSITQIDAPGVTTSGQ